MKRRLLFSTPLIVLLVVLLLPRAAQAQLTLVRSVVGNGAAEATGSPLALRGTVGQAATRSVAGSSLTNGQGFWYVVGSPTGSPALALNLTLFLEGPYNGSSSEMDVNLSGDLPETDPYLGSETVPSGFFTNDVTGQRVVDWVYLQLRSGDPTSPPMTIEAEEVALVLDDGSVVDTDGSSEVVFANLAAGSYYVVVRQRNHLAVMSSSAVSFDPGPGTVDFTGGGAYGTNAQMSLPGGSFGLFTGDGDASGGITATDQTIWLNENGTAGYLMGDFNLSGGATATDQTRWLQNNGTSTQVPAGQGPEATASVPVGNDR